jgi:hypothetical protein
MMGREFFNLLGLNTDWISGPVANCYMKGNHLGLEPHAIMNSIEGMIDDIETISGIRVNPSFNRKGAEILSPRRRPLCWPGTFAMGC